MDGDGEWEWEWVWVWGKLCFFWRKDRLREIRDLANLKNDWITKQVIYFKQRRVMEFNKQKTLEKLRNEGVKGVPPTKE